jgi:hypothetical protein
VVNRPPEPNLMVFVVIKSPHFVHFNTDFAARMGVKISLIHMTYEGFFFFNSAVTVSRWMPRQRAMARVPFPFTDNLVMDALISGLQAL